MVEREGRNLVDGEPSGFGGIVAAMDLGLLGKSVIGNGDGASAGVTVDFGETAELGGVVQFQSGLFLQLAQRSLLAVLVHVEETSRYGPTAFKRLVATLNEQGLKDVSIVSENDTVASHGRSRIFVSVHKYCVKPIIAIQRK